MKWFKFYGQDYLTDPKMLSLNSGERSCWITLLCFASVNDEGTVAHLSEFQLMVQSGLSPEHDEWDFVKGIFEKLEKLEMITHDNGIISIRNWNKRQGESLTGYQRIKKYRERKKRNDNNDNETRNANDNNRIEENRIEENTNTDTLSKKKKKEIVPNGTDDLDDVEIIPEEKPKTPKKKDYKKYDDETPFTLSEFVSSMEASPQRHVKIIGMYADTKQIKNSTKGQWRLFTDRNLASARRLSPYSDEQIARAFSEIEKNMKGSGNKKGYITRWTLETIEKYLEEI